LKHLDLDVLLALDEDGLKELGVSSAVQRTIFRVKRRELADVSNPAPQGLGQQE